MSKQEMTCTYLISHRDGTESVCGRSVTEYLRMSDNDKVAAFKADYFTKHPVCTRHYEAWSQDAHAAAFHALYL